MADCDICEAEGLSCSDFHKFALESERERYRARLDAMVAAIVPLQMRDTPAGDVGLAREYLLVIDAAVREKFKEER